MLSAEALEDAFMEMSRLAQAEGLVLDLAVYGGSALMLASNFRIATQDVDAVAEQDQRVVQSLTEQVAADRSWPRDWLNDGVRTYLSPNVDGLTPHHALFKAYPTDQEPGLRIFVPTPEYLLAMKLMAMRLDESGGKSDLADIRNLLAIVRIESPEAALAFAAGFYPEAKVSARLRLGLREIWRMIKSNGSEPDDDTPRYLGRSGPAP